MVYLYIGLSAGCSVLIAHLLKITEVKKLRTLPTLTANYFFAAVIAFGIGMSQGGAWNLFNHPYFLLFSGFVGAFFIGNFLMYSKSVHANGVGVTIAAMRVSLLVPVLISIYFYQESISWATASGIVLVIGAMVLLIPKKESIKIGGFDAGWLLVFIFLVAGFADASLKVYEEEFSLQIHELIFMSYVFGAAFFIGVIAMIFKKESFFSAKEAGLGAIIGIPNLYSSIFLIYALAQIDGAIAYPLVNTLSVGAGAALGFWIWKDTVSPLQWIGIAVAVLAIVLLL